MKEESLLGHASELVRIIRKSAQPGDAIASEYFRSKKYIGAKDRRFISEWVFTTQRQLSLAEAYGKAHGIEDAVHACFRMLTEKESNTAVIPSVSEEGAGGEELGENNPVVICTQPWLLDETLKRWPDAAEVWRAMMEPAPLGLRVNLRRVSREKVMEALRAEDIPCEAGQHAPAAIVIHKRVNLTQHALFKGGFFEIQDEGSQMISLACKVRPGMSVLDACAGAGGKTLHLADIMKDQGVIVARDIEWNRLREIPIRAHTAGVQCIRVDLTQSSGSSSSTPDTRSQRGPKPRISYSPQTTNYKQQTTFDVVLVDAPCSGMGTVRRLPMVKWRMRPDQLQRHVRKQQK
ncbi:MAG: RsmB/NOP family class I SAM-dependent RNA methyltransferase, partial [Ignavibacteriae bacterium]